MRQGMGNTKGLGMLLILQRTTSLAYHFFTCDIAIEKLDVLLIMNHCIWLCHSLSLVRQSCLAGNSIFCLVLKTLLCQALVFFQCSSFCSKLSSDRFAVCALNISSASHPCLCWSLAKIISLMIYLSQPPFALSFLSLRSVARTSSCSHDLVLCAYLISSTRL